jgi:non-heme chloroperoxidase
MQIQIVMPIVVLCLATTALAAALLSGGPKRLVPMPSINEPFKSVNWSDLPGIQRFTARDNVELAYRFYPSAMPHRSGALVLIHGSSADSRSMHDMAKGVASAGYANYVLDIRGHGESGTKGTISYIGQLEDDLEDFVKMVTPDGPLTLVGFSSGGGFVLRFAADRRRSAFDHYVLLSPFLHRKARTARPSTGGWVNVGMPRYIALTFLNKLGLTSFNHLPVASFALTPEAQAMLTPQYSFNLAENFRPHDDYLADIRAAIQPMSVLAGAEDEVFHADQYAAVFADAGRPVPVITVPNTNHIGMTLNPGTIRAITVAIDELRGFSQP